MINYHKSSVKGFPSQKYHHLFTLVEGLTRVMYAILNVRATHLHFETFLSTESRASATSITDTSNPLVAQMAFIVSLDRFLI